MASSASRKRSSSELAAHKLYILGGGTRTRTEDEGFAVLCLSRLAMPPKFSFYWSGRRDLNPRPSPWQGDALPTELLPPLKLQWCRDPELNWGRMDFQSIALPSELSRHSFGGVDGI